MREKVEKKNSQELIRTRMFLRIKPIVLFSYCLFMYMPKFNISSIVLNILSLGIPAVYVLLNIKLIGKINTRQCVILFFAILLASLSFLVPAIHGTGDYSYLSISLLFFRRILVYLTLLCLIVRVHGTKQALQYFLYYFSLTHVAYVVVTLLMVIFPGLKSFWFSIIDGTEFIDNLSEYDASKYMFRIGWQGFSGFRLTLYCTLSALFVFYLRYGVKPSAVSSKQFSVTFMCCILGNMFYGRSGLVITVLLSFVAILYWNRKNIKHIITLVMTTIVFFVGISILGSIPALSNWYSWMSSPFVSFFTTGEMHDGSFRALQEMHQVEITGETLIFGDGYYNKDGHYYMNTDAGLMRNLLFWGTVGAIVSYGVTLYGIIGFRKISKLLMLQLLLVFITFEYKGAVYYEFLPLAFIIESAFQKKYNRGN